MDALKTSTALPALTSRHLNSPLIGRRALRALLFTAAWTLALPLIGLAQRDYEVVKPRERTANEKVIVRTVTKQPTEGVLVVVLDPIIPGKVVVEDASGRMLGEKEADETGQAEFTLPRHRAYQVKASAPGYTGAEGKSKVLQASETVRLKLTPQFAGLKLRNLPAGAQILIDDRPRATADSGGTVTIADLKPGDHTLTIRHPEYNDFRRALRQIEAGEMLSYPEVPLEKVAKLTLRSLPGAAVLIDGERRGEVQADGSVTINYQLSQASEHTIAVELLGYQPWSRREQLTPGARTIVISLEPVVTSAGFSDLFDDLSQWNAPSGWQLRDDRLPNGKINRKLVVSGEGLGTPKGMLYRDFEAVFTLWLPDGKGASWAVRVDKTGRNYYLFHLAGPKSDTPNKFYTYLVRDGRPIQVSTPIPVVADLNQKDSYTIKLIVRGYKIEHFITSNGTGQENDLGVYTDTTDTKNNFLYGTFGFRSLKGESFVVDDFSIAPQREAEKVSSRD